jgi:hypothetical protein
MEEVQMKQISYSQGQPSRHEGDREKTNLRMCLITPALPLSAAVGCLEIKRSGPAHEISALQAPAEDADLPECLACW